MWTPGFRHTWPLLITVLGAMSGGCDSDLVNLQNDPGAVLDQPGDVDAAHAVCDPFANDPNHVGASNTNGLVASLTYLPDNATRYTNVTQNFQTGVPLDATLFFSDINVPTRSFDLGFTTQGGSLLLNADGNKLYEYFSIRFSSVLELSATDAEGDYQFGFIADDGAVLSIDRGHGMEKWVDDDGTHPSKFMGSTVRLTMHHGDRFPIQVDYYQGPRYHIALVLMWRPFPVGSGADPLFGQSGNSLFFDWTQVPSAPLAPYNQLLSRGWAPVPAANFMLPDSVKANPCQSVNPITTTITSATPPDTFTNLTTATFGFASNYADATFVCSLDGAPATACVSGVSYTGLADGSHVFSVFASSATVGQTDSVGASHSWTTDTVAPVFLGASKSSTQTSFTITWSTSEASTTELSWGLSPNLDQHSNAASGYTTAHSITVSGLQPNTIYSVQIVSVDDAGNVYTSPKFSAQTQP